MTREEAIERLEGLRIALNAIVWVKEREAINVALQVLSTPPVPEGWVMVPREPTDQMDDAAADAFWEGMAEAKRINEKRQSFGQPAGYAAGTFVNRIWDAMIAASPPPEGR